MSQPTPPPDPSAPQPARKKRRWLRRILLGVVVLILLLIVLVLLAPMILSTSPARSFVVGQINDNLNGRAQINDWSLGWRSGIVVQGVKVFDDRERLILELGRLKTDLTLLDVINGRFELGETIIDEPNLVQLEIDEQGRTNYEKLVKAEAKPEPAPRPRPDERPEAELPQLSGTIKINNLRGTIIAANVPRPIYIEPSSAEIRIRNINDPIENLIKLVYRVGDSPPGTIALSGTADVAQNNRLNVEQLTADQTLEIASVDLAAAAPFLKMVGQDVQLGGIANGRLHVTAQGLAKTTADGQIDVQNFLAGGEPLQGDTFRAASLSIPVKVGVTDRLHIQTLRVQLPQATLDVSGEFDPQALQRLAEGNAPGGDGAVQVSLDVNDLPDIVNQLPNTLRLVEGLQITSGKLTHQSSVKLSQTQATIQSRTKLEDVAGTRNGQRVALAPIETSFDTTAVPTGTPIPQLRDLALQLQSQFATLQGGGESLAQLKLDGNFDLARLRRELGQFVDFGELQLAGTGTLALSTSGDPTETDQPIVASANIELNDLKVSGIEGRPPLDQPWLAVGASAQLVRGERQFLQAVKDAKLTLKSGDPRSPTVDLSAEAELSVVDLTVPRARLVLDIPDLPRAQREFGAFLPASEQMILRDGSLHTELLASYDGQTLKLDQPLVARVSKLSVQQSRPQGPPVALLENETIDLTLAGRVENLRLLDALAGYSPVNAMVARISTLELNTSSRMVRLSKPADRDIVVGFTSEGLQSASGLLDIEADLQRLASLAQSEDVRGGALRGNVEFARGADGATRVTSAMNVTGLTIRDYLRDEQVKVNVSAATPDEFATLSGDASVVSSFANVTVPSFALSLKGDSVFEMLHKAELKVDAPDLAKVQALADAFAPPGEDAPPRVASGSAVVNAAITREGAATRVNVDEVRLSGLSLRRGERTYRFERDVTFKLAADVEAAERIRAIRVNQLFGDVGVATISAPEPITIELTDGMIARGALTVEGSIDEVTRLLQVLQDTDLPYRGRFAVKQKFSPDGERVALLGDVQLTDFRVLQSDGGEAYREDRLAMGNDILLNVNKKSVWVKSLTLDTVSSGAMKLNAAVQLVDWESARRISEGKLDVEYDLAKIWEIVRPMLSPEQQEQLADLKIAGKHSESFRFSGAYPDAPTFQESIRALNVNGGVAVGMLDYSGALLENLELKITLNNGVLSTAPDRQARVAKLNGGSLDLSSVRVDLTGADPLISFRPNHPLARDVALNAVLADVMGRYVNLLFNDAQQARGLVDVTVIEAENVPLGELMQRRGRAKVQLSVRQLELDGAVPMVLASVVPQLRGRGGLTGSVDNATFELNDGTVWSDFPLTLGQLDKPLRFTGGIGLDGLKLKDFQAMIPSALFGRDVQKFLPGGVPLVFKGTTAKWEPDIGKMTAAIAQSQLQGGLGQILGGGDRRQQEPEGTIGRPTDGGAREAAPDAREQDPLGGLLDVLQERQKKKEEERERRRERRREEQRR